MRFTMLMFILFVLLTLCGWSMMSTTAAHADGEEIYMTYCKSCHGKKGNLGLGGAAKLNKSKMPFDQRLIVVAEGKGKMAPFGKILSEKEVEAVVQFTMKFGNE